MFTPRGRKLLPCWLEENVNRGSIPGLEWHDQVKGEIRIPWKNKKNPSWKEGDGQIFREYAIFTNRYRHNDEENSSGYWKALLRSALHQCPYLERINALHKPACQHPYRVYRILKIKRNLKNKSKNSSAITTSSPNPDCASVNVPTCRPIQDPSYYDIDNIKRINGMGGIRDETSYFPVTLTKKETNAVETTKHKIPTFLLENENPEIEDREANHGFDTFRSDVMIQNGNNGTNSTFNCDSNSTPLHSSDNYNRNEYEQVTVNSNSVCPDLKNIITEDVFPSDNNIIEDENCYIGIESGISLSNNNNCLVEMQVFCYNVCVLRTTFDGLGARLFCGDLQRQFNQVTSLIGDENTFGPPKFNQLCLPYIDEMTANLPIDLKQKQHIRAIQNHMNRGLLIKATETHISARRLCKARIIICDQEGRCYKMIREDSYENVFNLDKFRQQLHTFNNNSHAQLMPSPSVIFSFGQEIERDVCNSWHVPIYAKFTHLEAERILKENQKCDHSNESLTLTSKSIPEDNLAELLEKSVSFTTE